MNNIDKKSEEISKKIAFELKIERQRNKYTIEYVCDKLQMSKSYLSQIENGKRTKVSMQTLIRLCLFYQIDFCIIVKRAMKE